MQRARGMLAAARDTLRLGHLETAVSRAYYAVFHAAEAALRLEGEEPRTHQGVKNLFGLLLVKTGKVPRHLGRILGELKNDREEGDYSLFPTLAADDAEAAVRNAEQFVAEIAAYLAARGFPVDEQA
jgi:uncharacterized protein (UPF0332 family)